MNSETIEVHRIGSRPKIYGVTEGRVTGIQIKQNDVVLYEVSWFYDGSAKSSWFHDFELEFAATPVKAIGFKG